MFQLVPVVVVHVPPGRHPPFISLLVKSGDLPEKIHGKVAGGVVQFPGIRPDVQGLLLHALPPGHGRGIGVVDEPPKALPPFDLVPVADEISLVLGLLIKGAGILDNGAVALAVYIAGHPERHPYAPVLNTFKEFLGIRITGLIESEIVVDGRPGGIHQVRADRKIMFQVTIYHFQHEVRRQHIVFPYPGFQCPCRGEGRVGMALCVERHPPQGEHNVEIKKDEHKNKAGRDNFQKQFQAFGHRETP
ncbi:MAG: hypothetical protein BWX80_03974 [Candidatus Hydrogenedentes bacterium ADurb.Bin101]|nr:MAG: hypothetical protein BWX80_03974 [Candidatus Hydrogenedentes bacterium ADurb.Bin101]